MPLLPPERLAALVDELPTADEQALLAAHPALRAELEALRRLRTLSAAEKDRVGPPLTTWASLSAQLSGAGLATSLAAPTEASPTAAGSSGGRVLPFSPVRTWGLRVAAAAAFVVLGFGLGRVTTGVPFGRPAGGPIVATSATNAGTADGEASATPVANTAPAFASRADAATALEQAERTYRLAAAFLAEHDSTDANGGTRDLEQVQTRLAALEQMVATSRAALYAAPQDPVINQYYLATLGAREATLRQISGAQPVAVRVAY
ncbi:MAG: hypothetical protein MUF53_04590 [Gemmatimonadaceae bacterium]|nr:hypothetical protein [Gemmatimonadaceae bacterium]